MRPSLVGNATVRRPCRLATVSVGALLLALAAPEVAPAQGIAYTITPAVTEPRWDAELGLPNDHLYGGRLGMDFGRFVSLRGFYLMRDDAETRLGETELRDADGQPFAEQGIDLRHYGADVIIAFGASALSPFIIGSGGILTVDPETRERSRRLSVGYGGGVRFGAPGGFGLELMAQEWRFRFDRFAMIRDDAWLAPDMGDPQASEQRRSTLWSLGANIPLGGDRLAADQPPTLRWGRTVFPAELFAGRLDFDRMARQHLVGARAGIDVGRQVGLRGFYWRGVEDGFTRAQPIQSWGGETQFNLSAGIGAMPFVVLGAGQLDFRPGYESEGTPFEGREAVLIAGGGLAFTMADRFHLTVSARDYMTSGDMDLEDVATPDQLRHNWLWSAGLRFGFGGGGDRLLTRPPEPRRDTVFVQREPVDTTVPAPQPRVAVADTLPDYTGERAVTLPVPREGELYVRYGPGERAAEARAALGAAEIREAIRYVIRDELEREGLARGAPVQGDTLRRLAQDQRLTPESEERIARRVAELLQERMGEIALSDAARDDLLRRVDQIVAESMRREIDRQAREGTLVRAVTPADPAAPIRPRERTLNFSPREWSFHLGLGTTEATQMLFGARADLGQPWARYPDLHLVPELTFGLFGGLRTTMLVGNLQYSFPDFGVGGGGYMPYAMAGLGLLHLSEDLGARSGAEAVLNLGAGVSTSLDTFGNFGIRPARVFLEYQGVDLFSLHRLLVGVQARF